MDSPPSVPSDEPEEPSLPVPLADADLPAWWGPILDSSLRDREQLGGTDIDLECLSEHIGSDSDVIREFASTHAPTHRYLVVEPLSMTMWACVYVAIDMATQRPTVLKISRRKVELEGSLIATLNHPNVVTVHDVFVHAGYPTTVLEWCEQGTLHTYARGCDWRDTLARALEAGRGLAYLHARGLVHADIKPTNILINHKTGKLGDLGLAGPETTEGPTWGTLGYLAPERQRGVFTFAGDVYSFALTVEHSLRDQPDVPRSIGRVLDRALVSEPERRPSLEQLLADLQRELDHERFERVRRQLEHRRQRSWLQTAVMLAVLGCVGGTVAIAAVCSQPTNVERHGPAVDRTLELAVEAAVLGDGAGAVQYLELAARRAKLDADQRALRQVATVAESLGHRFDEAGDRVAAGRSWLAAMECLRELGDSSGLERVNQLIMTRHTEH